MIGKVARKKDHTWARDPHDFYVEPERVTADLLSVERFIGPVFDPSCGQGNILRAMSRAGVACLGSDIVRRVPDDLAHQFVGTFDFLTARANPPRAPLPMWHLTNIVCNPPFYRAKGTEGFILKALEIAAGKVCIFASIKFLAGQARGRGLWSAFPPTRIWVLSERPSCPPGEWLAHGNEASGGTDDWCWFVWDLTAPRSATQLGWIVKPTGADIDEAAP